MVNPESFKFLEATPIKLEYEDDEKEKYFAPYVIIPLSDLNLSEGITVRLACKIDGYPKPKVFSTNKNYYLFQIISKFIQYYYQIKFNIGIYFSFFIKFTIRILNEHVIILWHEIVNYLYNYNYLN
jgi:hypothetical protein